MASHSSELTQVFLTNVEAQIARRGWSLDDFAAESGISKVYWYHLKAGRRNAGINTIEQAAQAFEMPAYKLLTPATEKKVKSSC